MRKLFKDRKLFKGGNYMRKYGIQNTQYDLHFKEAVVLEFNSKLCTNQILNK